MEKKIVVAGHISVIAQIDHMVSINSCVAVDLYGQVAAESSGVRQISGTGGQLDFLIGASASGGVGGNNHNPVL